MTIYWDQCDVCGRHHVTRQCTLHSGVEVCIHCCFACIEREFCPKPVWIFESERRVQQAKSLEDKKKLMQELISKLGREE